ncbi:MAG: hypothetical protein RL702_699, partial [Pseudomonadota bacterium]
AKTAAWKAVLAWVVRGALALVLMGMAWKLGATGLLK